MSWKTTGLNPAPAVAGGAILWTTLHLWLSLTVPLHVGYCSEAAVGVWRLALVFYEVDDEQGRNPVHAWQRLGGVGAVLRVAVLGDDPCPATLPGQQLRRSHHDRVAAWLLLISLSGNLLVVGLLLRRASGRKAGARPA